MSSVLAPTAPFSSLAAHKEVPDGVMLVGFTSPPQELEPSNCEDVDAAVHELIPECRVLTVDSHDWSADPFARGTWMAPRPGTLSDGATGVTEPFGRLVFAGADIATRWVGWIDGAIESGSHAATVVEQIVGDVANETAQRSRDD